MFPHQFKNINKKLFKKDRSNEWRDIEERSGMQKEAVPALWREQRDSAERLVVLLLSKGRICLLREMTVTGAAFAADKICPRERRDLFCRGLRTIGKVAASVMRLRWSVGSFPSLIRKL